jgi:hypothetical protein
MKYLAIFILLTASCFADPIPFGNFIITNQPGGVVTYAQGIGGAFVSGSGSGWLFQTGVGVTSSGTLDVTTALYTLDGTLSRIYFNTKTGLLQAQFIGQLRWATGVYHVYHATFYESISLANKTTNGGHVIISEAPEPTTLWLLGTGLAVIPGRYGKTI